MDRDRVAVLFLVVARQTIPAIVLSNRLGRWDLLHVLWLRFRAGITSDFFLIGRLDGLEQLRIREFRKDVNVRHHAMATDDSREILGRQELDFVVKRGDFGVVLIHSIAVPLNFLRPGDDQPKVSRFR